MGVAIAGGVGMDLLHRHAGTTVALALLVTIAAASVLQLLEDREPSSKRVWLAAPLWVVRVTAFALAIYLSAMHESAAGVVVTAVLGLLTLPLERLWIMWRALAAAHTNGIAEPPQVNPGRVGPGQVGPGQVAPDPVAPDPQTPNR